MGILHTQEVQRQKGKMRNEYICPPELGNGAGTWASKGRRGLTGRGEEQVLSDWRWATQIKGVPGNCPPPGKTPFSIFLGNWWRGRCFSRPQGLSCLRLRMTHVQRWCVLGTLVLNPFKGLLTSFLLKCFLSWDFCGNQTQKALHGLCVRF